MVMLSHCSQSGGKNRNRSRMVLGVFIILFGGLLLANNIGVLPYQVKNIIFTWQMLLIAVGFINLAKCEKLSGLLLIFIGAFFLIPDLVVFDFDFRKLFWPVLLIGLGLLILFKMSFKHGSNYSRTEMTDSEGMLNDSAFFGGGKKFITSQSFKGGKIVAIFGGFEIDLTQAKLAPGKNVLEIACIFGGITLIVPPDWNIRNEVSAVLGGIEDKRRSFVRLPESEVSELVITGTALFGGGEIKSYGNLNN